MVALTGALSEVTVISSPLSMALPTTVSAGTSGTEDMKVQNSNFPKY